MKTIAFKVKGVLTDIGTEELAHMEIISAIIIFVAGIIFNIVRYKRIGARH